MHGKPIQDGAPVGEERDDAMLLSLVLSDEGLWSREELARELDVSDAHVQDSIARLYGAGLLHRMDGFVFPTKAALKLEMLSGC